MRRGKGPPRGPNNQRIKELLAAGLSNKEIAARLRLSNGTVRFYITRMFKELGLYGPGEQRRFMVWILTGKLPEAPAQ